MKTPRRPRRIRPVGLLETVGAGLLATIVFLALNYGLNAVLQTIDKAPVRDHIRQAFVDGDLGVIKSRADDSDMGVHQANDCLIFDMAAHDDPGNLIYLFAASRTMSSRGKEAGNCELLRDWLQGDKLQRFWEVWYLRYIHGYRAVAIGLLENFSVSDTRLILKTVTYASCLFAVVLNIGFAAATRARREALTSRFAGYAILSAALFAFFGLPYFGQSISHAPAIITLASFIGAWSILDRLDRLSPRTAIYAVIVFSLFTCYFEFLTGYLPVGCCVIAALVAIKWGDPARQENGGVGKILILAQIAFSGTAIAAFGFHTVATAFFDRAGANIISLFLSRLGTRMAQNAASPDAGASQELTLTDVTEALIKHLSHLGVLPQSVTVAVLLLSMGAAALVAFEMAHRREQLWQRISVAVCALSFLPVAIWIVGFQNHTTIHAAFMVRLLAVVPMAGCLGLWAWYRLASHAAPANTSNASTAVAGFADIRKTSSIFSSSGGLG